MKKKRSKLTNKFVLGFIILGIAIIAVACYKGYSEFKDSIEKQYNDEAYKIAYTAASYIDEETAIEYGNIAKEVSLGNIDEELINSIISSDKYKNLQRLFDELRISMQTNDIYLVYVNFDVLDSYSGTKEGWKPFTYILDWYVKDGQDLSYVLGDQSPINPTYLNITREVVKTGIRTNNYLVSESDYGYNTTALITIDIGDENLALGVEIPMTMIETSISEYLKTTIVSTIVTVFLGILILVAYLYKNVILPINTVSNETSNFINNQDSLKDKLEKINTNDEIEDLSKSVIKMEADLKEYIANLTKVTAEKERIGAELDVARDIQTSMLPCIFPAFPDRKEFDIFASMLAAKEVGGDFYDFFMVDEDNLAVVMADVSGKGVPAALFMVIGKTLIKDHTTPNRDLGEVFRVVNNLLCESNSEGLFITAFEGVLNLKTGEFRYVNAGHEMPLYKAKGNDFEAIKIKPGFVLAGMENIKYQENVVKINPGDRIFLYTDGIPEATNINNELFGMERTIELINKYKDLSASELLPKIKEGIDDFVGEASQFDDITMLCLDYKEKKQ